MVTARSLPAALLCMAAAMSGFWGNALAADLDYAIFRNGEKVGDYSFAITDDGRTRRVRATMRIVVKLLGVTVYHASHERREVWSGGSLISLDGRSDYNGKTYDLALRRDGGGAALVVNGVMQPLGPCFFTFVPWIVEGEKQAQLVTEKGRLLDVSAQVAGRSPLPGEGGKEAYRHCLYAGKSPREAWYDESGALVLLAYKQNNAEIRIRRASTK